MIARSLCRWFPTLALAAGAAAQGARWLPEPHPDRPGTAAYDAVHHRTVWACAGGATARLYEWDGSTVREWLPAPGVITTIYWFGIDPANGCRLLLGRDALGVRFGTYDGTAWQWQNTQPPANLSDDTRFAYDTGRRRLVAYHPYPLQGSTLEFDGTTWSSVIGGLPQRFDPGLAYDPVGQRCVLYGGFDATGALGDCWSWDGTTWTQLHAAAPPGPRADPGMCHFPPLGGLVLYGNETGLTSTWLLVGNTWVQLPTAHDPGFQRLPALVPDPNGLLLLLSRPNASNGDGWYFTGSDWVRVPALEAQVFRNFPAFAFDPVRGQVVVHGGTNEAHKLTMVYDTRWHDVAPTQTPGVRGNPCLAWSPVDQQVLLFGGRDAQNQLQNDTWSWNGTDWTPRPTAVSPPPRIAVVCCTDPLGGVMLFGGFDGAATLGDHWRWDGTGWSQLTPATLPPPQFGAVAALDAARARVVLVGTRAPGVAGTWEWDGATWTLMLPTLQPLSPGTGAIAWDPANARVVLASGALFAWDGVDWTQLPVTAPASAAPTFLLTDPQHRRVLGVSHQSTSRLQRLGTAAPAVAAIGSGCALGAAPVLGLTGEPRLGQPAAAFELRDAQPQAPIAIAVGLRTIQQPIGPCTLRVDAVVDWLLEIADANGSARRELAIPWAPALRGMRLVVQGFAFDPATSPIASVAFTAALAIAIGD